MYETEQSVAIVTPSINTVHVRYLDFVIIAETWHGGLAMGYMWSRIVVLALRGDVTDLARASVFAETLASFSTISQEARHENLPSWYAPSLLLLIQDV